MIYGYCRVSTKHQRIMRQITNIQELYPNAVFIKEFYTGTTQNNENIIMNIDIGYSAEVSIPQEALNAGSGN